MCVLSVWMRAAFVSAENIQEIVIFIQEAIAFAHYVTSPQIILWYKSSLTGVLTGILSGAGKEGTRSFHYRSLTPFHFPDFPFSEETWIYFGRLPLMCADKALWRCPQFLKNVRRSRDGDWQRSQDLSLQKQHFSSRLSLDLAYLVCSGTVSFP